MNLPRLQVLKISIITFFILIVTRLFYWQIIKSPSLRIKTQLQTYKLTEVVPARGIIYSSDNYPLALNQTLYQVTLYLPVFKEKLEDNLKTLEKIKPGFVSQYLNYSQVQGQRWVNLPLPLFLPEEISQISVDGLTFQPVQKRLYSENTLASEIIGSLNSNNLPVSGLESFYHKQLQGKSGYSWTQKDALENPILSKRGWFLPKVDGVDLHLTLNRAIQSLAEEELASGLSNFAADSGIIIVMKPENGSILALTNLVASGSSIQKPTKTLAVSDLFEPGSIFKPIVLSMALEEKSISQDFICFQCHSPKRIGEFQINNWDNSTHPNSTLKDIIKNSDNIGMSYIMDSLGLENFLKYFKSLGLNTKTGIDLPGETKPLSKQTWPKIDQATASFGQGFAITPIQMITAFNAIANNGNLVKPHFAQNYSVKNQSTVVFSSKTTELTKDILKYATEKGAVSGFKPKNLEVCGKSGTAQIALLGTYQENFFQASYIGFSPCSNPKFTIFVSIKNPKTSPWGSSTAAPIWFNLASKISNLLY